MALRKEGRPLAVYDLPCVTKKATWHLNLFKIWNIESLIDVESGSYQVRILSPRLSLTLSLPLSPSLSHSLSLSLSLPLSSLLGRTHPGGCPRTFDRFAKRYAIKRPIAHELNMCTRPIGLNQLSFFIFFSVAHISHFNFRKTSGRSKGTISI